MSDLGGQLFGVEISGQDVQDVRSCGCVCGTRVPKIGRGRLLAGSLVRVIRIAAPNGTGTYWTQWVPLRVACAIR